MRNLKHKFSAVRSKSDGINFPSKLERRYYEKLKLAVKSGELIMFLRQPLFDLPGGITYRADFIEFWKDGEVKICDIKGFETKDFLMKKKMVEDIYPILISVIKKV